MSIPPTQTPPPTQPTAARKPSQRPRAPLVAILYILFFRPSLVFGVLQRETLTRSILRVLGLALLSGLLLTIVRAPSVHKNLGAWADWLTEEMGDIELADGQLKWTPAQQLPYGKHFRGWRVSFVGDPNAEFDPDARYGPETSGLWISPKKVFYWQKSTRDQVVAKQVLDAGKLFGAIAVGSSETGSDSPVQVSLTGNTRRIVTLTVIVMIGVATVAGVLAEIVFYTALFTLIPILLRSPQAAMGLKRSLVLYLHISLVPLIVAMVYAMLQVPYLDFKTVFAFVFLGYLALVVISARAKLKQLQNGGSG